MAKDMRISLLLDFYGDMLTDKQRDVVDLYYNDDLSLSEIAENEGITRQGVRDSLKRAEGQLLEMEQRLGLAARFRTMQEAFSSIRRAARDIQEFNARFGYSRDIDDRAQTIADLAQRLGEEG